MIYKKSNITKRFLAQQQNKYISVTDDGEKMAVKL